MCLPSRKGEDNVENLSEDWDEGYACDEYVLGLGYGLYYILLSMLS